MDRCTPIEGNSATFIWEQIDGKRSVKEIASTISRKYEITQNKAELDVKSFLGSLFQQELIIKVK